MIRLQRRLRRQGIDEFETRSGAVGHADCNRAIELYDRRGHELRQRIVERGDPRPVGLIRRAGARMAGGDGGLQRVVADAAAESFDAFEGRETAAYEKMIPLAAVLFE